ncbi:MAG: DUF3501 family protein [Orrella sp.]
MTKIKRESLLTLEAYHKARPEMRKQAMQERRTRSVHLGDHLVIIFENELLMRYQIQEMLRVEKVFEESGIMDEIEAYEPLVPDGSNFKATMQIEYTNEAERKIALGKLLGIEDKIFVQVEGQPRVYAIADEDLDRSTDVKTSSVHFLRFELNEEMKKSLKSGAQMMVGCDHKEYPMHVDTLPDATLASLVSDLT